MKNFKVRCINENGSSYFKLGKVYDVIDGGIISETGNNYNSGTKYYTVEKINENCVPQFELVKEEFTKADIKDGMILTYRNGCERIVINKVFYSYPELNRSGNSLNNYNDDLTLNDSKNEDIIEVSYDGEVVWRRKEYFYTLEEAIRIANEEYKNIKHKDLSKVYNPYCITDVLNLIKMVLDNKSDVNLFEIKEFEIVD